MRLNRLSPVLHIRSTLTHMFLFFFKGGGHISGFTKKIKSLVPCKTGAIEIAKICETVISLLISRDSDFAQRCDFDSASPGWNHRAGIKINT